jgi:translation initiation factor IF-1
MKHLRGGALVANDELIRVEGVVKELLSNGFYQVEIQGGHRILCHVKGKMKRFNIRILQGDSVSVEMSPYDLTKGRIVYRNK